MTEIGAAVLAFFSVSAWLPTRMMLIAEADGRNHSWSRPGQSAE
jgi:hypothetical protein